MEPITSGKHGLSPATPDGNDEPPSKKPVSSQSVTARVEDETLTQFATRQHAMHKCRINILHFVKHPSDTDITSLLPKLTELAKLHKHYVSFTTRKGAKGNETYEGRVLGAVETKFGVSVGDFKLIEEKYKALRIAQFRIDKTPDKTSEDLTRALNSALDQLQKILEDQKVKSILIEEVPDENLTVSRYHYLLLQVSFHTSPRLVGHSVTRKESSKEAAHGASGPPFPLPDRKCRRS